VEWKFPEILFGFVGGSSKNDGIFWEFMIRRNPIKNYFEQRTRGFSFVFYENSGDFGSP
jgi:hypothetical protein